MKKLLISASAAAFLAATPALAQNVSTVDQTGADSTATVGQTGNGNNSDINQDADRALAEVTQSQGPNSATINQNAGADGGLTQQELTKAVISQITSPAGGPQNVATITQNANSSAFTQQIGVGNLSTITQDGESKPPQELPAGYAATVLQIGGSNNVATIDQPGAENTARSWQFGSNSSSSITQSGASLAGDEVNNVARVEQSVGSDNAFSSVIQDGQNNTADVLQSGSDHVSNIMQTGADHVADVKQYGFDQDSTVNQSGMGNTATVTQGSQ